MDKKRIFIAIGFFILCVVLGYFIYRFFFAPALPQATPNIPKEKITSTSTFPEAGLGGPKGSQGGTSSTLPSSATRTNPEEGVKQAVTQVITDAVTGVSGSKTGLRYYNAADGKFYRLDSTGKAVPLDDKIFFNVSKVTWSPKNNESILEYPDGSNIYYNFETKKQVTLPKHWETFSFSPNSDKIAAKSIALSADGSWLISSSPDGQNVKLIESLGENADKVNVDWSPNQQFIATSRTGDPLGADQEQLLFIGQNHENFKSITVEGRGITSSWSPNGGKLLYSVYSQRSDYKPELWIANATPGTAGTERKLLNINTWANKCAFQNDQYVYCGIPTELPTGAGFVPDIAKQTPDTLVKIDVQTGAQTPISFDQDQNHVVDSIFFGEDGKTLYFTDKNQPGLFQVSP